ncbi:hypothetical protein ACQ4M4_20720 [Leptolyngbya sp. AN02str]|uniref:hypothetical protein n=1 Tax=Leptolyngbya sp. AN02str TaxID=3423363 RepID=UPI003D311E07
MVLFSGSAIRQLVGGCSLLLLAACSSANTPGNVSASPSPNSGTESADTTPEIAAAGRSPGEYCFQIETDTLTGQLRFMLEADGSVLGGGSAVIQDDENSYYTSYRQQFDGQVVDDNQLELQLITEIEEDVQNSSETWTLTESTLDTGREVYTQVDCADLLTEADMGMDVVDDPTVHVYSVEFDPGTTGTTVEGSVIRGERDVYLLSAQANQLMTLTLTSLEDNAALELMAPDGLFLEYEATETSVVLPQTGEYQIRVGGTRGNATYRLEIEIK